MKVNVKVAALLVGMALANMAFSQQSATQTGGANAAAGSQAGASAGSQSGAFSGAAGNVVEQNFQATQPLATQRIEQDYRGTYTLRTAPTIGVPNIFPTAPCMGSSALGVSVVGTGVSGGTSWIHENCEHRENARLLQAFGDIPNAKIALCMQSTMASHPMCAALKPQPRAELGPEKVSNVDPRDPRVTTSSEQFRDGMLRTKSTDDAAFTKAAMLPTEPERKAANCAYAKQIGDNILADRFGCVGKQ